MPASSRTSASARSRSASRSWSPTRRSSAPRTRRRRARGFTRVGGEGSLAHPRCWTPGASRSASYDASAARATPRTHVGCRTTRVRHVAMCGWNWNAGPPDPHRSSAAFWRSCRRCDVRRHARQPMRRAIDDTSLGRREPGRASRERSRSGDASQVRSRRYDHPQLTPDRRRVAWSDGDQRVDRHAAVGDVSPDAGRRVPEARRVAAARPIARRLRTGPRDPRPSSPPFWRSRASSPVRRARDRESPRGTCEHSETRGSTCSR